MRKYRKLTEKQNLLMQIAKNDGLRRINILHGSVRSGKTWISLVLWCIWIRNMPQDKSYLMTAKTLTTLKRNCLDLLEGLAGRNNFKYSLSKKEATLYGRKIYLEGVNDAGAESKIRGMTLQGAYCDEVTLFTEEFFSMLLSRLSEPSAKLFGTTNPDNPNHWFKVNYIDRRDELDFFLMEFLIDDNSFLDEQYVKQLKQEYTGVFYKRFILGEWCSAEGLVYPMFDEAVHTVDDQPEEKGAAEYYISIDYGTLNPCSMGLWRLDDCCAFRIRESYYSGKHSKVLLTDEEYYMKLVELARGYDIKAVIIDPSAASFIATIRRHGEFNVRKADNNVLNGIRITGTLLQSGKLLIHKSCKDAIREFGVYSWDEQSEEDRVVKEFDHAMDDIRYFCTTVAQKRLL
ncbi:MAG: PBSX family phage terminase large subunit [Clostridia bacterium]|nr:PBSX family phage terminase large subunit [Oscillospiraceae bacterium]MBQ7960819.1 PBSX family phage terminase large subunit [Clostridia bacterium]